MACDVCGKNRKVESVTVTWRGKSFVAVLCSEDAKPVEALEAAGSMFPRKTSSQPIKPAVHKVIAIS